MKKVLFIFGTRPEAIKLAPLVLEMRKDKYFKSKVCVTSQHISLLEQALELFNISPDYDLKLMRDNQRLDQLHSRAITSLEKVLEEVKPELVVVQGDTTSAFCGAISAFYKKISIAHIEAGLRSFDKYAPFPEEINRRLITVLTDYHFCPTQEAKLNLLREGISSSRTFVVGNTVLDALRIIISRKELKFDSPYIKKEYLSRRIVLVTIHRRESWDEKLLDICSALKELAIIFKEDLFILPAHPNPLVKKTVSRILRNLSNFIIIPALDYKNFILLMKHSYLILTDSGGIQEEAPSLKKPVLVLRDKTERPELVKMGAGKIIGTSRKTIVEKVKQLLTEESIYKKMINKKNPFGDGFASKRTIRILRCLLS